MIRLLRLTLYQDLSSHRSGWPFVFRHLLAHNDENGIAFDDFVEASYSYRPLDSPMRIPWVGIFHHPPLVVSPIQRDKRNQVQRLLTRSPLWHESRQALRGAVCLSNHLAERVSQWLGVPTLSIRHPTDLEVTQWDQGAFLESPAVFQVGFFLRDTRAIFRLPMGDGKFRYYRSQPYIKWQIGRDQKLYRKRHRQEVFKTVSELPRLDDQQYDEMLSRCVVLTHLFGASANNVVVECIARNTPVLVNRLNPVIEYLGPGYPLFYNNIHEIPALLDASRILEAHTFLREMKKGFLDAASFAGQVVDFAKNLA